MLLAVDQGTSATKAMLVDARRGDRRARRRAVSAWRTRGRAGSSSRRRGDLGQRAARGRRLPRRPGPAARSSAVGLSTQRESLVLWERDDGAPLGPLLSWQDQRTARALRAAARRRRRRARPARSAGCRSTRCSPRSKARWLLDRYDPDRDAQPPRRAVPRDRRLVAAQPLRRRPRDRGRQRRADAAARRPQRRAGTRSCSSCSTSRSRCCPRVVASSGPFPACADLAAARDGTPVTAVLGDSHAALFAHAGWRPGHVKATYGTGSSIMSLGDPSARARRGLCLTVAWDDGEPALRARGQHPLDRRDADAGSRSSSARRRPRSPSSPRRAATASTWSRPSAGSARRGGTTRRSGCSAG